MKEFIVKNGKEMKYGYTTGSCATAATVAAAEMLLSGSKLVTATINLPSGEDAMFQLNNIELMPDYCFCSVTKDGGDDPDVTHGAEIFAKVVLKDEGIEIVGGKGVGVVTTKGMRCPKGEHAINPTPRKMIKENLELLGKRLGYSGGFFVEISVPAGEELAKHTYNPRLGIVGGISILGTTGIVEPMSEKALVDTIKIMLDKKYEENPELVLISPGNYGQEYCANNLGLDIEKAVKMSNYIGETLDYIKYKGFKKVLLVGHTGKLVKIAGGLMNTHSSYGDCRMEIISAYAALLGAEKNLIDKILQCVTTDEAMDLLIDKPYYEELKAKLVERVKYHLDFRLKNSCEIQFTMFTTDKKHLMESEGFKSMIEEFKNGNSCKEKGKFIALGVGPGDPELLTLKAVKTMENADVIALPKSGADINIALKIAGEFIKDKKIVEYDMPMSKDKALLDRCHRECAKDIEGFLDEGKAVVFLTLGDPCIYSTCMYVHRIITKDGYNTSIVNGIPSFCAAAASLNCSLCEKDEMLHIVPATFTDLENLDSLKGTKVLMKSGKTIMDVKEKLSGKSAALVERATMSDERIVKNLDEMTEPTGYFSIVVVHSDERREI